VYALGNSCWHRRPIDAGRSDARLLIARYAVRAGEVTRSACPSNRFFSSSACSPSPNEAAIISSIVTIGDTTAKATAATPTKMELATEIYKRMRTVKDVTRKDIIEKFIAEVKLTKAGASTYYQLIKDKHEPQGKK